MPAARPPSGLASTCCPARFAPVTTGHADGLITIDLAESDDAHRDACASELGEPYRTLLGHLRHEIGHYYCACWSPRRRRPRARAFGDERADYQEALDRHYASGPPVGLGAGARERLRDDAPLGGLGRDLRPLPAHPRHAADRGRVWARESAAGADSTPRSTPTPRLRSCSPTGSRSATRSTR